MSLLMRPILVQWPSVRKWIHDNCYICIKLTYSLMILFLSLYPVSLIIPPNPATSILPTAAVPASPNSCQCTRPAVPRRHPYSGWRSSMDGPGKPGSGRPWDVGSGAKGEGQAVSWLRAHCIWGKTPFIDMNDVLFFVKVYLNEQWREMERMGYKRKGDDIKSSQAWL